MGVKPGLFLHDLHVFGMALGPANLNDARLVHFVRNNPSFQSFPIGAFYDLILAHAFPLPFSATVLALINVWSRAISRRSIRICIVFFKEAEAARKRALNRSC